MLAFTNQIDTWFEAFILQLLFFSSQTQFQLDKKEDNNGYNN